MKNRYNSYWNVLSDVAAMSLMTIVEKLEMVHKLAYISSGEENTGLIPVQNAIMNYVLGTLPPSIQPIGTAHDMFRLFKEIGDGKPPQVLYTL